MTTSSNIAAPATENSIGALLVRGAIAGAVAAVANALLFFILPALFNVSLNFPMPGSTTVQPLPVIAVLISSFLPGLVAALLLFALHRFTARPVSIFRIVAAVFAVLSLGAPLTLSAPLGVQLILAIMHIVAAAAIIFVLTPPARS